MNKEKKEQVKREPVAVRMTKDIILLGRSLARSLYGNEDKLGNLMEEAIQFYSANREDEARASALFKMTEERLIRRISDQFESMSKNLIEREKGMVNRIASLQAVSAFETCLSELMLKERLVKDPKDKARYEELRSTAAARMKDRLVKAGAEQIADLEEQNINLQTKINELEKYIQESDKKTKELEEMAEHREIAISNGNERTRQREKELEEKLREIKYYSELKYWYELRDKEVPEIQEENKTMMGKQKYEDAMKIFESKYIKPIKY